LHTCFGYLRGLRWVGFIVNEPLGNEVANEESFVTVREIVPGSKYEDPGIIVQHAQDVLGTLMMENERPMGWGFFSVRLHFCLVESLSLFRMIPYNCQS